MKTFLLPAILLLSMAAPSVAQETAPFALQSYGHFKRMQHMKNPDGVVDIKQATSQAALYGVGAPADGTGEITVFDGKLWIDYGVDGLGKASHEPQPDEQAVLLVTAQVTEWRDVIVPNDMSTDQMHSFIIDQAAQAGIDTSKAFPFLIEGTFSDFDWHILNGLREGGSHGNGGLFHKIKEHRDQTQGTIVGFYSASLQGVYTHVGESFHLHVIFESEDSAGHIDGMSLNQGSVLKLPMN